MNKVLVVVGPTAVGKTELAVEMAKKFNGELVSSDSKQVYKQLNIGTGKDVPLGAVPIIEHGYPVYEIDGIPLWGYDLVDPKDEFSVAEYVKHAKKIIESIWNNSKLPIIVGGTGFYVQALLDGVETMDIPQNKPLRRQLDVMKVEELFEILAQLDATKAASLNSSDRKNKVRLVRAIEVADARIRGLKEADQIAPIGADSLFVGITTDREILNKRIEQRVKRRVEMGLINEIEQLLESGVMWEDQSMKSLGYRQWRGYFEKSKAKGVIVREWTQEEQKYAKRQTTWFKRDKRIEWFDAAESNYIEKVERSVQKWYSSSKNESTKS